MRSAFFYCLLQALTLTFILTAAHAAEVKTPKTVDEDGDPIWEEMTVQLALDNKETHLEQVEPDELMSLPFQMSIGKNLMINDLFGVETRLYGSVVFDYFDRSKAVRENVNGEEMTLKDYEGNLWTVETGVKQQLNYSMVPQKFTVYIGLGAAYSYEDLELETDRGDSFEENKWKLNGVRKAYRLSLFAGFKYYYKKNKGFFLNLESSRFYPIAISAHESQIRNPAESPALALDTVNFRDVRQSQQSILLGFEWWIGV